MNSLHLGSTEASLSLWDNTLGKPQAASLTAKVLLSTETSYLISCWQHPLHQYLPGPRKLCLICYITGTISGDRKYTGWLFKKTTVIQKPQPIPIGIGCGFWLTVVFPEHTRREHYDANSVAKPWYISHLWHIIYPTNYAHGLCFVRFCHGYSVFNFTYISQCYDDMIAHIQVKLVWKIWINGSLSSNKMRRHTPNKTNTTNCVHISWHILHHHIW